MQLYVASGSAITILKLCHFLISQGLEALLSIIVMADSGRSGRQIAMRFLQKSAPVLRCLRNIYQVLLIESYPSNAMLLA